MTIRAREASAALLVLLGCAGAGAPSRAEVDGLKEELRSLRRENEDLSRRVEALSGRLDLVTARLTRPAPELHPAEKVAAAVAPPAAPVIPPDLAVVKLSPKRAPRAAPAIPTSVPLSDPDPDRLEALARPGHRGLLAEAEAELAAARRKEGIARAHALEDFAARFPHHAAADNALVEASAAYAGEGKDEPACRLAQRVVDDYPAGDAISDALERLAACEARRGSPEAERRILSRLVIEYPSTPAAERAGARLATISGNGADDSPARPARSGP